jgi:glycosyltransferase involved in cell wall biosynthesis
MKKKRIVIASVLKPVDDTRMFGKMATTLNASGAYEVFIIGFPSQRSLSTEQIRFLPLKQFTRISFARFAAPFRIHRKIRKVKPEVLIVNTHELLIVALLNRIIFGTRIIYDIRENYYRNILYSGAFPAPVNQLLAGWVRLKERLVAPFFDAFLLAEKGYKKELNFFHGRDHIIENKAVSQSDISRQKDPQTTRLLFSGTLAESTGVFEAIHLTKKLHAEDPSVRLTIIGFCALPASLSKIHAEVSGFSFITLIGGDHLVPHPEIVDAMYKSDAGIVYYPPSPHTENSIPTKLYEYLAASLPILLQPNPAWLELCTPNQACIEVDFANVHPAYILDKLKTGVFYTGAIEGVTWESEGKKLLEVVENL